MNWSSCIQKQLSSPVSDGNLNSMSGKLFSVWQVVVKLYLGKLEIGLKLRRPEMGTLIFAAENQYWKFYQIKDL